jgi:hypothetical protein
MAPSYKLWHAELKLPTPEDRRADRTTEPHEMSGFWRINGARTKPDYPVAIWTAEGKTATIFQIGRKMMSTETHPKEWQDFIDSSWLKCTAVYQARTEKTPPDAETWSEALDTGRWKDGKPSREVTAAEKADIIPTTPAEKGGNAPLDENGDPIDEFWLQIKEGLASTTEQLRKIGPITSMDIANKAAEILERHRALSTEGEKRRKEEKKPHDDAAAAVQAKWTPFLNPAIDLGKAIVVALDKFRRAEEARLKAEQAAIERKERERLAEEERQRLAAEEAERQRQAESMGMEHQARSEEEIAEEAEQIAAETVAAAPVADTKVRVGTAHGRGVSKATVYGGEITDPVAFYEAVKDYPDVKEALQKVADRLGRANAVVPGYKRIEK